MLKDGSKLVYSASYDNDRACEMEGDIAEAIEGFVPEVDGLLHVVVSFKPYKGRPHREQAMLEMLLDGPRPISWVTARMTKEGVCKSDATRTARSLIERGEIILNDKMEMELP